MSLMNPLGAIRAVEKYAISEASMGLTTLDVASSQQFKCLVCTLRTLTGVTMDHVTEADEYLSVDRGTFNLEQRRELATTVKATMCSNIATPTDRKTTSGAEAQVSPSLLPVEDLVCTLLHRLDGE